MNNSQEKPKDKYQIQLPGIRQLAMALLVTVIACSIAAYLIIHQQVKRNSESQINSVIIPSVIKPKIISSNPRSDENLPMVFPVPRSGS